MNQCKKEECVSSIRKDNLTGYCYKHATKEYARRRRESGKSKEYYENNKEKMLEQARKDNKKSYQKNKEKRKEKVKEYRENNWEKVKEARRISYRKTQHPISRELVETFGDLLNPYVREETLK